MKLHINSEGEKITIEPAELDGEAVEVLCIFDDPPPMGSGVRALMLLDESTRAWLRESL